MKTLKSKILESCSRKVKVCWKDSDCGNEAQTNIYNVAPAEFVIQQGMFFVWYVHTACYFYISVFN